MESPKIYSPEWFHAISDNLLINTLCWIREDRYLHKPLSRGVIIQETIDNAEAELAIRNAKRLIQNLEPLGTPKLGGNFFNSGISRI